MKSAQFPISISPDDIPRDGGIWPEYASTMVICFHGIDHGTAYGELWSFYYQDPRPFKGLDHLLFTMEDLMNEAGYPKAWCETRNWGASNKREKCDSEKQTPLSNKQRIPAYGPKALAHVQGNLCTFFVRVYFRQNASMQGMIRSGKETVCFRSGLELMKLMQQVLEKKNNNQPSVQRGRKRGQRL